jgi:ABC-type phosphate transport system substrate-binding protein
MHHSQPWRRLIAVGLVSLSGGLGTCTAARPAHADSGVEPPPSATGADTVSGADTYSSHAENPLAALATLPYQPKDLVTGNLRIAGASALQQAAAFWCEGLELLHPDLACGLDTGTTEAGWDKLLGGTIDVALFDRPLTAAEEQAWDATAKQSPKPRRLAAIAVGFRQDVPAAGTAAASPSTAAPALTAHAAEHVPGDVRPAGQHPLYIVMAVPAEGDWPRVLEEFVSYVLSFSGQVDVAKDGLLPLSRAEIHAQQEALGWTIER